MIEWFYSFLITLSIVVVVCAFIAFIIYFKNLNERLDGLITILFLCVCMMFAMTTCTYNLRKGDVIKQESPHDQ